MIEENNSLKDFRQWELETNPFINSICDLIEWIYKLNPTFWNNLNARINKNIKPTNSIGPR